jgi:hypothetical protein
MFLFKMTEARPESPALLCLALALPVLLKAEARGNQSIRDDFIAGLFIGLMVVCSQKFVFTAAGTLLCACIVRGRRASVGFLAGALIAPLLVFAWLASRGAAQACWDYVFRMNATWKHHFSPAIYFSEVFENAGVLVVMGTIGILSMATGDGSERKPGLGLAAILLGSQIGAFYLLQPSP